MPELRITDVKAFPTSFPIAPANRVALGIGTAVKRDAVIVKVTTSGGVTGWGEAHHGRAHTAVAKLIETTLKTRILHYSVVLLGLCTTFFQDLKISL